MILSKRLSVSSDETRITSFNRTCQLSNIYFNSLSYSYLRASIRFRLAALRAGYHPKNIPTAQEKPTASRIDHGVTDILQSIVWPRTTARDQPIIIPIKPPIKLIVMASIMIEEEHLVYLLLLPFGFQFP